MRVTRNYGLAKGYLSGGDVVSIANPLRVREYHPG